MSFTAYQKAFDAILAHPENQELIGAFIDVGCASNRSGSRINVPLGPLPERLSRSLVVVVSSRPGEILNLRVDGILHSRRLAWKSSVCINLKGNRACVILDGRPIIAPGPINITWDECRCKVHNDGTGKTLQLFSCNHQ